MENKHLSGNRQPSPELFHPGNAPSWGIHQVDEFHDSL